MPTSVLTSQGQATIPKEIREALDLQPGDRVEFSLEGGSVVVRRASADISELDGILDRSDSEPVSLDEMDEAIRRRAAEDHAEQEGAPKEGDPKESGEASRE